MNVDVPTVRSFANEGDGSTILGFGGLDPAVFGYLQEEFVVAGTATTYVSSEPLSRDGRWSVTADQEAPYATRIVVRRPSDASRFNGTVFVEWLNVSGGFDTDADWLSTGLEMTRLGAAWVGVSAQKIGVDGADYIGGEALSPKGADPQRYGELSLPGDDWSYDIFSQAAAAVRAHPDTVLGELKPARLVAIGQSQSAGFLTTYTDAVQPIANVFDGIILHSRGAPGSTLSSAPRPAVPSPPVVEIRRDLEIPVMALEMETDVLISGPLGYWQARQPDTDRLRVWEIAGTAHADAYFLIYGAMDDGSGEVDKEMFAAMSNPPNGIYGGAITCNAPINTGPQTYVLRAALRQFDDWLRTGTAPPSQNPIKLTADHRDAQRDENGIAKGGVRTPHVDAPLATLSGFGQRGGVGTCFLYGTTTPLASAVKAGLYPDRGSFLTAWDTAATRAIDAGVLLEEDAAHLHAAAAASPAPTG